MADLDARMRDGFGALLDELPRGLSDIEGGAWAVGYLYAMAAGPCPSAIRSVPDGVLGILFEVDEVSGAKVGYVVMGGGRHMVPVRVYVR